MKRTLALLVMFVATALIAQHWFFRVRFLFAAFVGGWAILGMAWSRGERDKRFEYFSASYIFFSAFPFIILTALTSLQSRMLDGALYRIDLAIGMDPLALAQIAVAHPWFEFALRMVYENLSLAFAAALIFERKPILLRTSMFAAVAAIFFYWIVPAVGPIYAFPHYPFNASEILNASLRPRNCFPSLHLSWTILLALNVSGALRKTGAWIFVLLTAIATIGLGEHYVIDLIAAIPFSLAIQKLAERSTFLDSLQYTCASSSTPAAGAVPLIEGRKPQSEIA